MSDAFIRALPIWKGEVEIEPLSGGITNLNFRVTDGGASFAVRRGVDDSVLGISRRNELECTRLAARAGLAPEVVHAEGGVLVSAFIEGVPLTPELARDPERISRVAKAARAIHALGADVTGHLRYFCPFQVARTYIGLARSGGMALPGDAAGMLAEVTGLQDRIGAFVPTFCHGDLMPGNFLDTGDRLWIIDWEYAGTGNPLFDLAGFSSNCELDIEQDQALLVEYFGDAPVPWTGFRVMKAVAALRESLWAVVQGSKSKIDFDYDSYRDENHTKYRAALAAL